MVLYHERGFCISFSECTELNLSFELETELAKWESNLTQRLTTWETENLNIFSRLSESEIEEYWKKIQLVIPKECDSCCFKEQGLIISNFFELHRMKGLLQDKRSALIHIFVLLVRNRLILSELISRGFIKTILTTNSQYSYERS